VSSRTIRASGSPLEPGTPEVFVNSAGGGPDGIIIDEHDNLWIACNQSDEVMVLEPTQGRVIAKLGDFGGIDKDGAPICFLWSNCEGAMVTPPRFAARGTR
jgi:hypothetical protein